MWLAPAAARWHRGRAHGSIGGASTGQRLGIESDLAIGASYFPESEQGQIEAQQQFRESQAQEIGESTAESVMNLRPDRTEVGIAGQIIGEAMAILPRTIVGAVLAGPLGGAAAAGGPAGYSRKQVSMAEGIDESTATWLGLTEGVVTGVGAAIPMAGFAKSSVTRRWRLARTWGWGWLIAGFRRNCWRQTGIKLAAQYRALDATAMATDAIMGAAFLALVGRPRADQPPIKSMQPLRIANAQHADIDTAPGLPVDPMICGCPSRCIARGD